VTCPGCQRDNHPARRYCGGCGCNFEPACAECGFANEAADRFCGGCGQGLRAYHPRAEISVFSRSAAQTTGPLPGGAPTVGVWDLNELAELFAPAPVVEEAPDLPEVGINQDNLDQLFGDTP
jgi:Double zinc ribbon